jgi:2-dehydropantoate 2-reductase
MKIAVMGAGGQGCFFGACLSKAGNDVTFIARGATLEALKKRGVVLNSRKLGNIKMPVKATSSPTEVGKVELVLLCVKNYDLDAASMQIKPLLDEHTVVLPILNGVDVAEKVGQVIGPGHLLGGVSWVDTIVEAPGVVSHSGFSQLIFGELGGGLSERVERIDAVLRGAGIESEKSEDILKAIWEKFCFNAPANGAMALVRLPVGLLRESPEAWAMVRRALVEADEVAKACGVCLPPEHIDTPLKAFMSAAPWVKSSMLQDLEAGRRLELEALTGSVVRLGRLRGVSTPINETIYAALKPYEHGRPSLPKML